ncbi:helix-turn-helix domain-containing protein [Aurantibacter aestuarii]|uniref:HTH araC/xylS-type domain-containing protein n=1 Tax=Aurantibacter aestuarii TaxID=1266046 RepID=A0A2T1NCN4_9FLAO|nr:AraC family transcriptional regulator [Aurantibacter aestuarii]PSG90202.1 hypothetical protein C7H52_02690 [Aurantibacter aestuarii]
MGQLNFNVFNLLIFSGIVNGLIFSTVVLSKKKFITNNTIYLALIVLFLSLSNLQYWFLDTKITEKYSFIKYVFIPFHWLVLPMFYMYVNKFIGNKITLKRQFLLILPFLIVSILYTIQSVYSLFINKLYLLPSHFENGLFVYLELASICFNILLIILSYKSIIIYEKKDILTLNIIKAQTSWLKQLICIGLLICVAWLIAICIILILNKNTSVLFYPLWIIISLLIYWIGYVGINKSLELKERIQLRQVRIQKSKKAKSIKMIPQEGKEAYKNVIGLILNEKLHLDPKMSLKKIALKLDLSEGYISQLINKNSDSNFNDFLNTLRVKDAKRMLKNVAYNNYTLESIGLEAGFNSKTSFYAVFKKHVKKTPLQYKKDVQNL